MSKFVRVRTELREATYLKRALEDLRLDYKEDAIWQHRFSNNQRAGAMVVTAPGVYLGFAPAAKESGVFELLYDDMQKQAIDTLVGRIAQRYAYHKVLDEAQKAGFTLVEERTGADEVVRLTVRKWG